MYTHLYIYTDIHIHLCVYIFNNKQAKRYEIHMYVCIYMYIYICICTCILHTYICIYIYINMCAFVPLSVLRQCSKRPFSWPDTAEAVMFCHWSAKRVILGVESTPERETAVFQTSMVLHSLPFSIGRHESLRVLSRPQAPPPAPRAACRA